LILKIVLCAGFDWKFFSLRHAFFKYLPYSSTMQFEADVK
jgi:hypothetical protein